MNETSQLPIIAHAGMLEDVVEMPAYLMSCHEPGHPRSGRYSCCFCGVGDNGSMLPKSGSVESGASRIEYPEGAAILNTTLGKRNPRTQCIDS